MPRKRRIPIRKENPNRLKTGVSGARFRKDPVFKGSRRAMGEFGLASRATTILRQAFASILGNIPQNITHLQLTRRIAVLVREKKAAGTERIRLNQLQWEKLLKFEFNPEGSLSALLASNYKMEGMQEQAKIDITLDGIRVSNSVHKIKGITHVRITLGAAAIDFEKEKIIKDFTATAHISKKNEDINEINLSLQLTPPVVHPLFIALGFSIFKQDGPQIYELHNLRYRALSIIHVQPAPPPEYKKKTTRGKATIKPAKKKQAPKTARLKNKRR